jgi:hypothetical protein
MKKLFIAALIAASTTAAAAVEDGQQWSQSAIVTGVAVTGDTWTISTTQLPVVGNRETPIKFRGSSKLKNVRDVPIGSVVNVIWCVTLDGACDTRAESAVLFGLDPSADPVEFHVGNKSFPGFK